MVILFLKMIFIVIGQAPNSTLFQCQPDRSGLVYVPNIPDAFFEPGSGVLLANESLFTIPMPGTTYIFTHPPTPPLQSCKSTVVAIELCYLSTALHTQWELEREIFNFMTLNPERGRHFRVSRSFVVEATPSNSNCMEFPLDPLNMLCCNTVRLNNERFQIPPSNFTFALTVLSLSDLLAFSESRTEFHIPHIRTVLPTSTSLQPTGSIFQVTRSDELTNRSPPIVRLHAGT